MIPKIIHYCWLSDDPVPETLQGYMKSWKEKLPDYEFILWNFNRFDKSSSIWVSQAFDNKKYAFAADYIRLYAVYNYGGIYMDMDIEVLKSFDDLLNSQIDKLKLECEEKDRIIHSVSSLKDDLAQNVSEVKKYKEEYKKLITELRKMKAVMNQEVFKGKWRLIKLLIK